MEKYMKYCEADVSATLNLYKVKRYSEIQHKMMCIRKEIDSCDDFWVRCKLARKLKRLRTELERLRIELEGLNNFL